MNEELEIMKLRYKETINEINNTPMPLFVEDTVEDMWLLIEKQQKEIESWKKYCDELEEDNIEISNKKCELEFEIEKLKNDYNNLSDSLAVKNHCIKNSIPVEAIKDKIENGGSFEKYKDYYQVNFVDYNNGYLKALYELLEERN